VALQTRPPNQTIAPGSAGPSTGPATGAATAGGATADGSSKAVAPPPAAPTPPTPPSFANSSASSAASASPPPSSAAAPTWPPSSSAAAPNGGPPSVSLAAPPPATDRGHTFQVAGLITGGAGVVMIVVGIIEGVRARNAASDVEAEARNGVPFDPSVESRGQTAETAQWWLLGLGALAGAGGAGLWLYGRHVSATAERSPDAGANRVSFVPVVSPERAGAWLRVRF
jgi:hypothetical protein